MRLLLDECVPRKLRSDFEGHDVRTVQEMGWAGKKNGELVRLAADSFDVLITEGSLAQRQS
jgi:predicted nuclease of predicted toxin-antitoxin system